LLNLKTVLLLGTLLFCSSGALQAATAPAAPEPATPAKPELLVEGGLLGAISSSIDGVQDKLDLNQNLIDAWRLRADRAADEVDKLVNQPSERSSWSVAGDFLVLSGVWIGAFAVLTLLGRFLVKRLNQQRHVAPRQRLQALLGYLIPYTIPAVICLPLTLYVSHFLPTSVGRALALCFAYATSSGIFSTSMLLCVIVMFNVGHKRPAVRIIRDYCPKPLFLIGFLAALSDALTSPQIARQLGGNITASVAIFTGLFASVIFGMLVIRLRRPVAHLIRNRPLAQRLKHPAVQQSLRVFSGLWYWPILLMVLVSAINLIGAGDDSQKALRCALFTTILLIGTVFLSTVLQHLFQSRSTVAVQRSSAYKERFLSLLHALLRIVMAIAFIEILGRIWGVSLFEFAQRNSVGRAISDSLSSIGLILLVTWLFWVVLDTAIQEALKPPVNKRSSRQPSTRVKTILPLLRNAVKIILVVICAITTMANLGINVAPLLAGAGVVGLAIGFGSQQLVQDVITGLFIIIEDSLAIDDYVDVGGHLGTVEGLTIRTVRLRDIDGIVHTIPFSEIKSIKNYSREFGYAIFRVAIPYNMEIDDAIKLMRDVGQKMRNDPLQRRNIWSPLEIQGVESFESGSAILRARFKTAPIKQWEVSRAFNLSLKRHLDEAGLDLATPRLSVQVVTAAGGVQEKE